MYNKVVLIGTVGKEPQSADIEGSDKKKVSFTMVTEKKFKDKSGDVDKKTVWHNIVQFWDKEIAFGKGSLILVEGEINNYSYETGNGEKKYISEVVAHKIKLLGKKSETSL